MSDRALKTTFWIVGVALFLVGLAGWYDRFAHGDANVNYGTIVPWGLWVAAYIYFIGLSAGAFLISSLVYVFNVERFERVGRLAVFTAVVTLFLALLFIWADLGHMWRAWHVLIYPNFHSAMAWMIWLYSAYFLILLSELWFLLRHDLVVGALRGGARGTLYRIFALGSRDQSAAAALADRRAVRVLASIGVPVAILFHGGVGALFGVLIARPAWDSGLFPILFLVSALASGGALLVLISAIFQDGLRHNRETVLALGRLVLALLLVDALLQLSEFLVGLYGGVPGQTAPLDLILYGPFWWVFWVWQIGIGTLIPILLLALPTRREPHLVALAGLLIAAGFLAVRLNIVIPGLASPEINGLAQAVSSARLTVNYVPSVVEWLVSAGVLGLGLLLFGLGEWLLPEESEVTYDVAS